MIIVKQYKNIYLIKMGRKFLGKMPHFTYSFLIDDVLIDSGPPCCKNEIFKFCNQKKISKIVNTHHHEDHIGGNAILHQKCGVEIYAPPLTAKIISQQIYIQLYRRIVWGKPEICQVLPVEDYIETSSGHVLNIIPTPGHCEDHVCFFEEKNGWLFCGDAFLHPKIKIFRRDENFYGIIDSLKKLHKLNASILFCSLNGKLANANEYINGKIEFMESLAFDSKKLFNQGLSPHQIKLKLLGRENSWFYFTAGHFSKQNLINSILK